MRSTSVPWGTRSTAIFFVIICCCAFGFNPIWLAVKVDTSEASISFPTPLPGTAASLQTSESSDLCCRTSSSSSRSGVPTPMKPPTITLAPLGIIATASSAETVLILPAPIIAQKNEKLSAKGETGSAGYFDLCQWSWRNLERLLPRRQARRSARKGYPDAHSVIGGFSRQRAQYHPARMRHGARHGGRALGGTPKFIASVAASGRRDGRHLACVDGRAYPGSLCLVCRLCHCECGTR